jgi:hypothetical protein
MKKYGFTFLFLAISFFALHAQKILIGKTTNFEYSSIDRKNNIIYVYGKNFYKKVYLDDFQTDSISITIDPAFNYKEYTPLVVDSISYFIHNKGGLVYQNRNDSIVRIDNSFNHLMQNNSSIFEYDSKIHRFGGYGFWSARNFITYFDNKLNEWEIINPINSEEIPEEAFGGLHLLIEDDLYVFNSSYNNPVNRYENVFNKKLWNYNFNDKKWTHLGDIEFLEYDTKSPIIFYNNKLLIGLKSEIIVIDVLNNTYKKYEKGVKSHYINGVFNAFFHNNRFYYFSFDTLGDLYLSIATESEMIGNEINSKPFYTNYEKLKNYGFSFLILVLLFISIRAFKAFYNRKNKIQLLENGLKFKRKFIQLDEKSLKILGLLVASEYVNSAEILKIVEKDQFSRAHNERLKFQKIEDLNFKLKTLLDINEDLIISKKSNFDRRIREYSLENRLSFINNK